MNYQLHYDQLMSRASLRGNLNTYMEQHHVIPKCLGGVDDSTNLVWLTAPEHFVAHQLLVKLHPHNHKLIFAVKMMTAASNGQIRNNKEYGWIKQKFSLAMSEVQKGKPKNLSHKLKLSLSNIGKHNHRGSNNPMFGKHRSKECKEKLKQYQLQNPSAKKMMWITNGINNKYVMKNSSIPEGWYRGRYFKVTSSWLKATRSGSEKRKGIKQQIISCPYCDTVGGFGIMKRWHFEHCKLA